MREEAVTKAVTGCDILGLTDQDIITRLEFAGKTLLALPERGFSPRLKQKRYDVVRSMWEAYTMDAPAMRPPVPSPRDILDMDEAIAWLDFIPVGRQSVRNVVRARMMLHPLNDRHLYSWRRIATEMHTDHKAIMRKHAMGIEFIKIGLAQTPQTTL